MKVWSSANNTGAVYKFRMSHYFSLSLWKLFPSTYFHGFAYEKDTGGLEKSLSLFEQ